VATGVLQGTCLEAPLLHAPMSSIVTAPCCSSSDTGSSNELAVQEQQPEMHSRGSTACGSAFASTAIESWEVDSCSKADGSSTVCKAGSSRVVTGSEGGGREQHEAGLQAAGPSGFRGVLAGRWRPAPAASPGGYSLAQVLLVLLVLLALALLVVPWGTSAVAVLLPHAQACTAQAAELVPAALSRCCSTWCRWPGC
jgi:hypothetical protein